MLLTLFLGFFLGLPGGFSLLLAASSHNTLEYVQLLQIHALHSTTTSNKTHM